MSRDIQPGGDPGERRVGFESAGPPPMRLRVRFSKTGTTRYLSHLDLLAALERALRRAGLPVAYSEGFHPHVRMHFGPPLPLGHASTSEWLDLDMQERIEPVAFTGRLNEALPRDMRVIEAREIPVSHGSLGSQIGRAVYRLEVKASPETAAALPGLVAALMARKEILVEKTNKKTLQTKTVDLRGFIDDVHVVGCGSEALTMEICLRLGPQGSVRPEDVLEALAPGGDLRARTVERVALQQKRGGSWQDPWP